MANTTVHTRRHVGGARCLDFANSVDWSGDGKERADETETLRTPTDVIVWGRRAGIVDLHGRLQLMPGELAAARRLRRAIHDVFLATARGEAPDVSALSLLQRTFAQAFAAATLELRHDGWRVQWERDDQRRIRFAVAVSAVDLLRDDARSERVRMCPGTDCGWLFLDASGRRRWCSMDMCGSREKMRRHYRRRRAHDRSSAQ